MGWEIRPGGKKKWHEHTLLQYKKPRQYLPDLVTRAEWGAKPPVREAKPVKHPVKLINNVYTNTEYCNSLETCSKILRDLQEAHFDMGLGDIAFNYMIGGDGRKYEGRGWLVKPDAPGQKVQPKKETLDIAIIGSYYKYRAGCTTMIYHARRDLLNWAICNKFLYCCFDIIKDTLDYDAPNR